MAKVEKEFVDGRKQEGDYKAAPFLPRKPIPDIGLQRIDGERFHSREFMKREWDMIWTKTWHVGCHVSELEEPGDFRVHSLGRESLLFVKGEDGKIRGFFNVCQHRGNVLCQTREGLAEKFKCPFHGWEWNLDGSLRQVMHPQLFPQFANGVPSDELALPPLQVDTWGGWVWFNMDREAAALRDFLGEAGRHLESYALERYSLVDHKSFEWQGNWKHAHDAFNESYHFEALHPEFLNFAEGFDVPIELLGIHSRMLNFNQTVSELMPDRDSMTPIREKMLGAPEGYDGAAKDVHLTMVAHKRSLEGKTHIPYEQMNDEQLVHQYHYTFFPSTTFTSTPEMSIVFRYRPHESDPNYCYYDFLITRHDPPDAPRPEVEYKLFRHDELPDYGAAFEGTFDPVLANVLQQDGTNMPTMQQGTASLGFRGMILGEQEVRLRHFHQTIDRYLMGDFPMHGDR
ncbi:(2Fe-2S)-binding protein [Novosphingobium marinum]|uniref:Phenylpropionate dioxygenase-like ring-hydroxylating dioxygenase large terminal subunit n=1 Tax=Novosphingobium marinum TaxID=1514948 RepID=A0A7Y9Y0J2_9SPHN|nr:aromatic ring-hydroxylating dioxygenase subunit alpha [Novosphingobium marinum]NYH96743.1 phenylpropionate dioxygenase-like ring-hydroxylating dioxygenase large terminal subunit [Novosphingobium marinum]GGC40551.1 (2Fe-2S)-binding protein [Novosphingobium marinum]